jgi:hypothetical protein
MSESIPELDEDFYAPLVVVLVLSQLDFSCAPDLLERF